MTYQNTQTIRDTLIKRLPQINNIAAVKHCYANVTKPCRGFCPLPPQQAHNGEFAYFIVRRTKQPNAASLLQRIIGTVEKDFPLQWCKCLLLSMHLIWHNGELKYIPQINSNSYNPWRIFLYIFFNLLSGGWVQLGPLSKAATGWPIVACPRWLWWRIWWNENWQGKPNYSEKTRHSATLPTTNTTWPDPGSNPGRRQRLTAWAMVRPYTQLLLTINTALSLTYTIYTIVTQVLWFPITSN
jgi:hypothetical protein